MGYYNDEENYTVNKYNKETKYKKKILCVNDVDSLEEIDSDSSCEYELDNFICVCARNCF